MTLRSTILKISWHRVLSGKSYYLSAVSKARLQPTEYSPCYTLETIQAKYKSLMIYDIKSSSEIQ